MTLRLVFMGTPEFAVPTLTEVVGHDFSVVAVYTQAPKPAGRGMAPSSTPIARTAARFGIPVLTPATLRSADAELQFRSHAADAAVVVAFGQILPKSILEAVPLGCFNLHASLLPRWRGAAPIHRAVMAGDVETGVMTMRMDEGLDTGPIAMTERVPIGPDVTTGDLHDVLARLGASLVVRTLGALARGGLVLTPQADAGATYAAKITKRETRIDWSHEAGHVHNHCRGLSPWPGAWFELKPVGVSPIRIKVLRTTEVTESGPPGVVLDQRLTVACGQGAVRLTTLQRAGRGPMSTAEFLRGTPVAPGTLLT